MTSEPESAESERARPSGQPPPVPPGPPGRPPPPGEETGRTRRFRWRHWVASLGVVALIVAVSGMFIPMSYVIIEPGDATPVDRAVSVKGAPTYPHRGSLLFLTVSVSNGKPNLWRFVAASLDHNAQVVSDHDYFGTTTPAQDRKLNVQAMDTSQQTATKVALEKLGYTVPETGKGGLVVDIQKGSPADGKLKLADVITAVDGQAVTLADQVGPLVRSHPAGSPETFTVDRAGRTRDIVVATVPAPNGPNKGRAFIGIAANTRDLKFDFPVAVKIDPGPVSGPSAGLAFALAILDEMTPGNLTGGQKVAVTGEILSDGSVGEIGGAQQKAVAARSAGARLMLVPRAEVGDARKGAGSLKVVGVRTLKDALAALQRNGGAPLEVPARRAA